MSVRSAKTCPKSGNWNQQFTAGGETYTLSNLVEHPIPAQGTPDYDTLLSAGRTSILVMPVCLLSAVLRWLRAYTPGPQATAPATGGRSRGRDAMTGPTQSGLSLPCPAPPAGG